MKWYAVRSVYLWGQKSDGTNVFEERVVAVVADSEQEAWEKALREAEAYRTERADVTYQRHPDSVMYHLDDGAAADGAEVWSEMFESQESLQQFYSSRYEQYAYEPE